MMQVLVAISRAVQHFFQALVTTPIDQPLDSALENAVVAEHELRLLFGAGHRVEDPFFGLVNVFSLYPAARRTRARQFIENSAEFAEHHILPLAPGLRRASLVPSTVFNIEAFKNHWELFTHGALSKMRPQDWDNIVVAGGSVLACLLPPPATSKRRINEHFQSSTWASSDIDIFLWGLSPEQAEIKMQDIYKAVCAAAHWKVVCVRRAKVVSIHTSYPHRPIQIVLRLYQSPAEVIAGFDIDAACCLYNGKDVWANPRAMAALVRQTITVDVTRRSPSYEVRLAKYAERGFEIYVPSLDRDRVSPSLYGRELRSFPNGLAKLLVLEALYSQQISYTYLRHPKVANSTLPKSNYDSNLKWIKIPYGPAWDAKRIQKLITAKDAYINSVYNPLNKDGVIHRHIFFVGSMRHCLTAACEECEYSAETTEDLNAELEGSEVYIKGRIRFMTTDPGRQEMIGSFRPINSGDWEREAYEHREAELSDESNTRRVVVVDSDSGGESDHADTHDEPPAPLQHD